MSGPSPTLGCACGMRHLEERFVYDEPPPGEVRFALQGTYRRAYDECRICGHWFSRHGMDMSELYAGAYVDATYGAGMRATFERIMALPPERSDNAGRVASINAFADAYLPQGSERRLLDIGSGLAVFPARMKATGWQCTALDPDPRAAAHAREVVGVAAIAGDFRRLDRPLGRFELVSFNKVLEHVEVPVEMLAASRPLVAAHGFAYVEVPDAAACVEGPGREEFFIDHHHVFSPASLVLVAERAGFRVLAVERLREPSSKFTLRAFLAPNQADGAKE